MPPLCRLPARRPATLWITRRGLSARTAPQPGRSVGPGPGVPTRRSARVDRAVPPWGRPSSSSSRAAAGRSRPPSSQQRLLGPPSRHRLHPAEARQARGRRSRPCPRTGSAAAAASRAHHHQPAVPGPRHGGDVLQLRRDARSPATGTAGSAVLPPARSGRAAASCPPLGTTSAIRTPSAATRSARSARRSSGTSTARLPVAAGSTSSRGPRVAVGHPQVAVAVPAGRVSRSFGSCGRAARDHGPRAGRRR